MTRFRAAIFDLDGVLVDSAKAHFVAWRRLAEELGISFSEHDNEELKGVDRMGSLRLILGLGGLTFDEATMAKLADRKNGYYLDAISGMSAVDQLPGAAALVRQAKANGLLCAVASASRNAPLLLDRVGLAPLFDYIADAGAVAHGKPAPDIFLACSTALAVEPAACLGFEDAVAGVEAIIAAGMVAVGIGDPAVLGKASVVYPSTAAVDLPALLAA